MIIVINAKRWFQKSYGNTYHSVTVIKDGEEIGNCPHAYGYGEQYLQTAFDLIQKYHKDSGKVTPKMFHSWNDFREDMMKYRKNYVIICNDVAREKDL